MFAQMVLSSLSSSIHLACFSRKLYFNKLLSKMYAFKDYLFVIFAFPQNINLWYLCFINIIVCDMFVSCKFLFLRILAVIFVFLGN